MCGLKRTTEVPMLIAGAKIYRRISQADQKEDANLDVVDIANQTKNNLKKNTETRKSNDTMLSMP